jgi:hypothetical protein
MTPDADRNGQGAFGEAQWPAVARLRFGVVPTPATLFQDVHGRLVIELQAASVPADGGGTFDAAVRTSREADPARDESGSLAEAIAECVAQWVDDQTRTVWTTPVLGSLGVSAALDRCQQSLLDAVKGQVVGLAAGVGAPALPAELAAGIGVDRILAPEMRREKDLYSFIDICVMGIGFATGQPHLVAVAVKHLMGTEFDNALECGAEEILKGLRSPAPAGPGPTEPRWIKPTGPKHSEIVWSSETSSLIRWMARHVPQDFRIVTPVQGAPEGVSPVPPPDLVDLRPQRKPVPEKPECTGYKIPAADPAQPELGEQEPELPGFSP